MEIFKIGDVVYDEVNFPNQKGIVKEVSTIIDDEEPIIVEFNDFWEYYTTDGKLNKKLYVTLSHTPYTIEFKGFNQVRPLTDEQKVCIKGDGTMEYGKKIIEYLESKGGKNGNQLKGWFQNYYWLDDNLFIRCTDNFLEGYKEISLKEVEPHICEYCKTETTQPDSECYKAPINYVGKKIVIDDDTCLIVSQNKVRIETSKYLIKLENIHKYEIID